MMTKLFDFHHRIWVALCCASLLFALSSCIDEEQPNMEADIEHVSVRGVAAHRLFSRTTDAEHRVLSQDSTIVFHLADGVEESTIDSIQLNFTLTPGATIALQSGDEEKFGAQRVVHYIVTAQDGVHRRRYSVQFLPAPDLGPTFSFDHPQLEAQNLQYYVWPLEGTQSSSTGLGDFWGSGNAGFALSNGNAQPSDYPTAPTDDARSGMAVKLTTRSTGFLGRLVGKPIAAGNLFVGTFDLAKALAEALKATQFGRPVRRQPLRFKGFYKWQPGDTFQNQKEQPVQGPAADGRDLPNIYAVIYRNTDEKGQPVVLDGTNVQTHPNVVALASVEQYTVTGIAKSSTWASFDVPFHYTQSLIPEVLAQRGYSLALVFASSKNGAQFEGAIGSTLIIDDCSIEY